jgi:hypothetical protein
VTPGQQLLSHSRIQSTHRLRATRRDGGSAAEESLMNPKYAPTKSNKDDGGSAAEGSLMNSKYAPPKGNKDDGVSAAEESLMNLRVCTG